MDTATVESGGRQKVLLDRYVDEPTLAKALGCSTKTIQRYTAMVDGLGFIQLRGRRLYDLREVHAFLEARKIQRNPRRAG